jgi:indolepyruvate ferredoxin oxidoreductase beta subunit
MTTRPIAISLHALGGQGGGVLSDWLVNVARKSGWLAQATSVPGVAQRTGATIYYLELFPDADAAPVLALTPSAGDVDLVLASELMEAGRAINRGLVTPDRTTLVATTSRIYAVGEKSVMGDGRLGAAPIADAARQQSRRLILFDMEAAAQAAGCQLNAVLLGAAANSGALPFPRQHFEDAIREGGLMVAQNLAGFAAGHERAHHNAVGAAPLPPPVTALERLIAEGERRLTDYQDRAYAKLYLTRLARFAAFDAPEKPITRELARHLALWMSYEDTIRVADLKVRPERFARVCKEARVKPNQVAHITEYLHPRVEEICDTMPAWLGTLFLNTPLLRAPLGWAFSRGRHITTSSLRGYALLSFMASLRPMRRSTLRYKNENTKIEAWLASIETAARTDRDLAIEIVRCQRLIKGYGDTYERGWARFQKLIAMAPSLDAAALSRLRNAALADSEGKVLNLALTNP